MFNSKKKTAIKALQRQRELLDNPKTYEPHNVWSENTGELVKKYIGEDSVYFPKLSKMITYFPPSSHYSSEDIKRYKAETRVMGKALIDGCIEYIKVNGLKKEHHNNFLSTIKVDWLVAIVVTGGGIIFGAGSWYSDVNNKIEKQEMKQEIEQLRKVVVNLSDSLRLLQLSEKVPDKNAKPPNDGK